jgi:hypothetical protein
MPQITTNCFVPAENDSIQPVNWLYRLLHHIAGRTGCVIFFLNLSVNVDTFLLQHLLRYSRSCMIFQKSRNKLQPVELCNIDQNPSLILELPTYHVHVSA